MQVDRVPTLLYSTLLEISRQCVLCFGRGGVGVSSAGKDGQIQSTLDQNWLGCC